MRTILRTLVPLAAALALLATSACQSGSLAGSGGGDRVQIRFLNTNDRAAVAVSEALAKAFNASQSTYQVVVESRPGGGDGDNLVKTRLSTGEMAEVFVYNSGSLMQAIKPEQNLQPVDDQPWFGDLSEDFLQATAAGGHHYAAPMGFGAGGGMFYNRRVYAELGLQPPQTWDQFMANNAAIKAAGKVPVIQTYGQGSTWTSQLFLLGDFHNVVQADPTWAEKYTANQAKYADPPALAGFQHTEDLYRAGYFNADAAAATTETGLAKLASGEGVHYPITSGAIDTLIRNHPDQVGDIGFVGIPGTDAATAGLTTWVPGGLYVPRSAAGAKLAGARAFVDFVQSPAGCAVYNDNTSPAGAYANTTCKAKSDVPQAVKDIIAYSDAGRTTPALEFSSPVKGPNLEHIIITVGTGQSTAAAAAARYDEDVKKQAQQLGLPGW